MIREFKMNDLEAIMELWLNTNIAAHDFIDPGYWQGNYDQVKALLPDATLYVYEEDNYILGFVGLMEDYIAGIFVDGKNQSKGIGKALLDYVKESHHQLSLQVYRRNTRAVNFYLREGFVIAQEQRDENTGEIELVMEWKK